MLCKGCGRENQDYAFFCSHCGQRVRRSPSNLASGFITASADTLSTDVEPGVFTRRRASAAKRPASSPLPRPDREIPIPPPSHETPREPPVVDPPPAELPMVEPPPARKKSGKAKTTDEVDTLSVMVVLVLVFIAILAVGAGGLYFNLRESHPELVREKITRWKPPELGINQAAAHYEGTNNPASPRDPSSGVALAAAESPVAETTTETVPDEKEPQPAPADPEETELADPELKEMINRPNTAAGTPEPAEKHKAVFRRIFGIVVTERSYPSEAMKQRALDLWAREQKILEPDGSITTKYALKPETFSPIPGH